MKSVVAFLLFVLSSFANAEDKNGYSLPDLYYSEACSFHYSIAPTLSCVGKDLTLTYDNLPLVLITKDLSAANHKTASLLSLLVQMNRKGFDLVDRREPAGTLYFVRRPN